MGIAFCEGLELRRRSDTGSIPNLATGTSTYLVSGAGDPLTSRPTVRFSALNKLPLVLFCRPSSWRDYLEQISAERNVLLNVTLEADSPRLQTHIVSEGGIYTLLGPYAVANVSKDCRLRSSKVIAPVITRHIALAMSRHVNLTLACRTVMQIAREIAKSSAAGLRRSWAGPPKSLTVQPFVVLIGRVRPPSQSSSPPG